MRVFVILTIVAVKNTGILCITFSKKTSSTAFPPLFNMALSLFSGNSTIFSRVLYNSTSVSLCGFLIIPRGFSAHYLSIRVDEPIFSILSGEILDRYEYLEGGS